MSWVKSYRYLRSSLVLGSKIKFYLSRRWFSFQPSTALLFDDQTLLEYSPPPSRISTWRHRNNLASGRAWNRHRSLLCVRPRRAPINHAALFAPRENTSFYDAAIVTYKNTYSSRGLFSPRGGESGARGAARSRGEPPERLYWFNENGRRGRLSEIGLRLGERRRCRPCARAFLVAYTGSLIKVDTRVRTKEALSL